MCGLGRNIGGNSTVRNPDSPRDFHHVVRLPWHLDARRVRCYAEENGLSEDEAREALRRAWTEEGRE